MTKQKQLLELLSHSTIEIFAGTRLRHDSAYDNHPDPSHIAWINDARRDQAMGLYPIDRCGRIRHDKTYGDRECPTSGSVWTWMNENGRLSEEGEFDWAGMPFETELARAQYEAQMERYRENGEFEW